MFSRTVEQGSFQLKSQPAEEWIARLGKVDDPNLPTHDVDLAFSHNVLHHIEYGDVYLKALASYLKPKGWVAIIDRNNKHSSDSPHQSDRKLPIALDQTKQWMTAVGFEVAEEFNLFEDKYFVIFSRNL